MSWAAEDILDRLLVPLGRERFFAEHWNRRGCALPGTRQRFTGLFDRARFDASLARCRDLKATFFDDKGWFSELHISPDQVPRLYSAGMTICAGILPEDGTIAEFLRAYRGAVRSAGDVHFNSYLSPDGEGFGLHFDNHAVWILQLEGAKRWRFTPEPAMADPPVNLSMPPDRDRLPMPWGVIERPAESAFAEVVLAPGDALYLPAGCWHTAKAEGYSLALTLTNGPGRAVQLLRQLLMAHAAEFPALFASLPALPAEAFAAGETPPALAQALASVRTQLLGFAERLSDAELLAAWQRAADQGEK
jgi:ribosomal protein L16 Arg81 hydroxylase